MSADHLTKCQPRFCVCSKCGHFKERYQHKKICHDCRNEWRRIRRQNPKVREAILKSSRSYYDRHPPSQEQLAKRNERIIGIELRKLEHRIKKLRTRIERLIEYLHPFSEWANKPFGCWKNTNTWAMWAGRKNRGLRLRRKNRPIKEGKKYGGWTSWAKSMTIAIKNEAKHSLADLWLRWAYVKYVFILTRSGFYDAESEDKAHIGASRKPKEEMCPLWDGLNP